MNPAAHAAGEDHESRQEHRDARGHDSDVGDAHPHGDDDGPRAAMMLLLFMARGLRVRHRILGPAQCINRAPITSSVFPGPSLRPAYPWGVSGGQKKSA